MSSSASNSTVLTFAPLSSVLTPAFWSALARLKVDELKLSSEPVHISGTLTAGRSVLDRDSDTLIPLEAAARFTEESFSKTGRQHLFSGADPADAGDVHNTEIGVPLYGTLRNFNTIEAFKAADKQAIFAQAAQELFSHIETHPSPTAASLNRVLTVAFAELKKYTFIYWFAYPAFVAKPPWQIENPFQSLTDYFSADEVQALAKAHSEHLRAKGPDEAGACLLRLSESHGVYQAAKVSDWRRFFHDLNPEVQPILCFLDPSSLPSSPGWPLRNLLCYLYQRHNVRSLRVVCLRSSLHESITGSISLHTENAYSPTESSISYPTCVGWEKNKSGKLAPRSVDLGSAMDPRRLADQAVDLNLKLMRWRILPQLNLESISNTRCLLLGAGTLGCYVSRNLMAWGVRRITFVDSGRVSFSNPVRQPLFEFSDCLEGGKPKAAAAADALRRVYPSLQTEGILLSIPMPGHPVPPATVDQVRKDVQVLEKLFDDHDVIFLLMDSRESRWLPTLLGTSKRKIVINAALGFDSYLVARHGSLSTPLSDRLGCYYCSDVVAPADSLSDRTLDQMCTVTRPGLAAIASATAVELMAALVQHPVRERAMASLDSKQSPSVLGAVPHMLRGYLADFSVLKITGQAYEKCTACSEKVVDAYRRDGFDLLLKAFGDAKYLEQITGLDKLQADTEAALEAVDWDEDD